MSVHPGRGRTVRAGSATRGAAFLGDLLTALCRLEVSDPLVATRLARMLSLDRVSDGAVTEPLDARGPRARDLSRKAGEAAQREVERAQALRDATRRGIEGQGDEGADPDAGDSASGGVQAVELTPLPPGKGAAARPAWWAQHAPMPPPPDEATLAPAPTATRRAATLLDPARERAVLAALAATRVADLEIDVERLAEALARRELPRELPRRASWSLHRGLQVLVDRGAAMVPFDADVEALLRSLRALAPDESIRTLHFTGTPLAGCRVPGEEAVRAWEPPPRGTPVLVVSELGIGDAASRVVRPPSGHWLQWAARCATAGTPLRVLVPYAPRRWPPLLAAWLPLLHWDRRLGVGEVRRRVASAVAGGAR